jgi:hypothetical protein
LYVLQLTDGTAIGGPAKETVNGKEMVLLVFVEKNIAVDREKR